MIQSLINGILTGAIGVSMVMHILRFASFAYAVILAIGAYTALVFDALFAALVPALVPALDRAFAPLMLTGTLMLSLFVAMAVAGASRRCWWTGWSLPASLRGRGLCSWSSPPSGWR